MRIRHNTMILGAGKRKFILDNGQSISKLEFDVAGISLVNRVLSIFRTGNVHLIISEEESAEIQTGKEISICKVGSTKGALISALLGLNNCDLSLPLLICPGDSLLKKDRFLEFLEQSEETDSDISLVVFNSDKPNYSYIRTIDDVLVEVCEKKVISSVATAGIFYFKSAQLFLDCAEWAIMNNLITNGSFFIAPSLNYAAIIGSKLSLFRVDESDYYRFSDLNEAFESEIRYRNAN